MGWPLVGREAVMRRVTARLADDAGGVAIVGDHGVGKTRLALEVRTRRTGRPGAVEWIPASASASRLPFGALAGVIEPPAGSPGMAEGMSAALTALRRRPGASGSLLLVVDDAHLLDEHSAALIHQVVTLGYARVLLTLRLGDSAPDAITRLWKDGVVERVEIGPLTQEATDELIEAVLEGPSSAMVRTELWRRSAGNPLYLRELLLAGIESGALVRRAGVWQTVAPLLPSARLVDLVRHRLGSVSATEHRVLEILAVADVLDLHTVERFRYQAAVERLEGRRLLTVERSRNRTVVRFTHPVYGEVLAAQLPRLRARRMMRRLADQLEATRTRRPGDVLRLALWRLEGGGPVEPELLLTAAQHALAAGDAHLAERLALAALSTGKAEAPARLLLGRALASQQRVAEADDALVLAAREATTEDDLARAVLARANLLYFRGGRPADAVGVLVEALTTLTDRDWRDEVDSMLALFRARAGELRAVAEAGRRVAERTDARPRTVVHTLVYSSIANVMLGRFTEAEREVQRGLELAPGTAHELPLSGEMLRINAVLADAYAGRLVGARQSGRAGHHAALDATAPEVAAMWGLTVAECLMLSGDVAAAHRTILEALLVLRQRDPFHVRGIATGIATVCAVWLGSTDEARALRREVADDPAADDVRSRIWLDRADAWAAWAAGSSREAALRAVHAGRRAVADTHLVWGAWLFHDAARLGLARPAAQYLGVLARRIEGDLVPAMAHHARALAEGDPLAIERAASAFDELGSSLLAAEAAAQAQQAYLRHGRARLAGVAASRAALLAARCPGVRTPALVSITPVPLTERELEIARLAAAGLPSRGVAERLGISVRTVDNHLGAIYSKLGVSGREALPTVLGVTTPATSRSGSDRDEYSPTHDGLLPRWPSGAHSDLAAVRPLRGPAFR